MKRVVYPGRREKGGKVWKQANQKVLIGSSVWEYFPLFASALLPLWHVAAKRGSKPCGQASAARIDVARPGWNTFGAGAYSESGESEGKNFTVRCATVSELHGGKVRARLNCCRVKRGRTKSYSQTG